MLRGDNPRNPLMPECDNWLTEWISRPRAEGPRARNPRGQPVIVPEGITWIIVGIPEGLGGLPGSCVFNNSIKNVHV